jgi:hypothetical protein
MRAAHTGTGGESTLRRLDVQSGIVLQRSQLLRRNTTNFANDAAVSDKGGEAL